MTRLLIALTFALAACTPAPPAGQFQGPVSELAGRIGGAPQRCVSVEPLETLRISDDPNLLLYGSGRIVWANRLPGHCSFRRDDILVTERWGPNHCKGDIVRSVSRLSQIPGPACVLNDFVPYRRP